jgi:hypothetical protein
MMICHERDRFVVDEHYATSISCTVADASTVVYELCRVDTLQRRLSVHSRQCWQQMTQHAVTMALMALAHMLLSQSLVSA